MIANPFSVTSLEINLRNAFESVKGDILLLQAKQWKQEDIYGKSCVQFHIGKYYATIALVTLIYQEINSGIGEDWDYYIEKYKLVENKKCLSCENINLDTILNQFGLPPVECNNGIECLGVQENFEVEPD